jgi:hypothetical protein
MNASRPALLGKAILGEVRPSRPKRRRDGTRPSMTTLRIANLDAISRRRFGVILPNDAVGRRFALVAANHIAYEVRTEKDAINRFRGWARRWCPWMEIPEIEMMARKAFADPIRWKADKLAWFLGITMAERMTCAAWTIGAVDCDKAARAKRRRDKKLERDRRYRVKGQAQRPGRQALAAKPWEKAGCSRATWYRRQTKNKTETKAVVHYQDAKHLERRDQSQPPVPAGLPVPAAPEARPATPVPELIEVVAARRLAWRARHPEPIIFDPSRNQDREERQRAAEFLWDAPPRAVIVRQVAAMALCYDALPTTLMLLKARDAAAAILAAPFWGEVTI